MIINAVGVGVAMTRMKTRRTMRVRTAKMIPWGKGTTTTTWGREERYPSHHVF